MEAAIGIVRVSRVRGREGDSFASPKDQAARIEGWCDSQNIPLLDTHEELDVSGGADLNKRTGLLPAIETIEAGQANTLVVAYFDRLVRSLNVQSEVVTRVEAAGGRVVTVDMGEVSHATAGQWLQGTVHGTFAEYYRRQVRERAGEAQARAIARGVATWDVRIPGYTRGEDGILIPDKLAPVTQQAFEMRRDGATIKEVREFLRGHGIERSYHGTSCLLQSRVVLGELHFGKLVNLAAHEPIVDRDLWNAVQRIKMSRGRRAKSDRLLARLGVLRCGECGARMTVGTQTQNGRRYPFYRCPPTGDCSNRQTIGATIAEDVISKAVKARIANKAGRASAGDRGRELTAKLDRSQADLDAAIAAFSGVAEEPAAVQRIAELRVVRDKDREALEHLGRDILPDLTVTGDDWEDLTLDEQRALIKATVKVATVSPGRGRERLTVTLFE